MCPAMRSKAAKRLRRTKQSNRAVRKANSSGVSWGNPSENYEKMRAGSFSRQPTAISLLGESYKPEQNYQQLLNGSFSGSGTKGDGSLASATLGLHCLQPLDAPRQFIVSTAFTAYQHQLMCIEQVFQFTIVTIFGTNLDFGILPNGT